MELIPANSNKPEPSGHLPGNIMHFARVLREAGLPVGPGMVLVTPGVRPAGSEPGGQKRVMTPGDAIRAGADHLVVARPVVGAGDPRAAAEAIIAEIASAADGKPA